MTEHPAAGMQSFLVGGAVRDRLMGKPVQDRDYVVIGARPETLLARGFKAIGADFPVFLHPESKEEYALARTERKAGTGHKGFIFHTAPDVSLEEDLQRRDLTINAMAEDAQGRLIDPYGGERDLHARILRHVSPAFSEDPLRVLRVARFAARYNFTVASETLQLMQTLAQGGELKTLTAERVWAETDKAMGEAKPARYIEVLRECGALQVLFPEIDALFGIPQPKQYHPEIDTGIHTLMVLEEAARISPLPLVRFSALVHDLGKAETPHEEWPSHKGHDIKGVKIIEALCARLKTPTKYRELAVLVSRHHVQCHRVQERKPRALLRFLEQLDAFRRPQRFEQFLMCCIADLRGRQGMREVDHPQAEYLRQKLALCNTVDVRALCAEHLQGQALANALRSKRIACLRESESGPTGGT